MNISDFTHTFAKYDAENGKQYTIKIRTELGTKTGLTLGAGTDGKYPSNQKFLRKAHFSGVDGSNVIKRTYPCSNAFWVNSVVHSTTIPMDSVTLTLTGFTGEKLHG